MHKLSIGFTFYKNARYSLKCLQSILDADTDGIDFEIVLSNNACPEGSDAIIRESFFEKFDNFKIVQNGTNKGCSGGWNAIINGSNSEYIWICNNDVIFHKDSIKNLFDFMEYEKDVLISSPMIIERLNGLHDDSDEYVFNIMQEFFNIYSGQKKITNTWSIISACARREIYSNIVGMFDERFTKAFFEDCDFGNRCRMAGVLGAALADSVAYHYGSRTTFRDNDKDKNARYFNKKYPNGFEYGACIEKYKGQYVNMDDIWRYPPVIDAEKIGENK